MLEIYSRTINIPPQDCNLVVFLSGCNKKIVIEYRPGDDFGKIKLVLPSPTDVLLTDDNHNPSTDNRPTIVVIDI